MYLALRRHCDGSRAECALYVAGVRQEGRRPAAVPLRPERQPPDAFLWLDLDRPDDGALDAVAEELGLHPLAVENALFGRQRPRLAMYGATTFVVLKPARYDEETKAVETGEVMLFVGAGFVITVRRAPDLGIAAVQRELEARPRVLRAGPLAVLYAILDRIVDGYGEAIEALYEDVEDTEAQVFDGRRDHPTERIYMLTREVLQLRHAIEPLVPVVAELAREGAALPGELEVCFRDVHDHLLRADEQVRGMEQLLVNDLTANLAQVAVQQNEDVRRISAWVSILATCTLIAGVYGMNFRHMPELEWRVGYPLAMVVMLAVSAVLYRGFRRNGWL